MRKLLILIVSVLAIIPNMTAQNEMQRINAIKSNIDFIYATGTSYNSAEEAEANARDLLSLEIEQWLNDVNATDIAGYIAKSQKNISNIQTRRGNIYRVFAFVKKSDIMLYSKKDEVVVVDFNKEETDTVGGKTRVPTDSVIQHGEMVEKYKPSKEEMAMLEVKTFETLQNYVKQGKSSGSIAEYGKYATMPVNGSIYIFVYNRKGEIPACLKRKSNSMINLATGEKDDISNYKGCGAIWIKK
ncbi:MAG: hypothetical protein ACI4SO_03340 [Muribaculaceae bacterium]